MSYTSLTYGQEPSAQPRNAKEFARCWVVPDATTLVEGNGKFCDMYVRQNRLVGQVIDACIALHVNERLKKGASIDKLKFFFPKKLSDHELTVLTANVPEMKPEEADSARLALLVKMIGGQGPTRKLRSHRDLASDEAWHIYKHEIDRYQEEKATGNPFAVRPEDPRISALSEHVSGTIQILNPGPKDPQAIVSKMERKGGLDMNEIRDINRMGVLPVTPHYAKEFVKIMKLLNPEKSVSNGFGTENTVPRMFEELPKVFGNGYYDQKIFVAQDMQRDRAATKGAEATLAEVKIVPAAMLQAAELSAEIKPLRERVLKTGYYTSDALAPEKGITKHTLEGRRVQLEALYEEQKSKFDRVARKYRLETKFKFPPFPKKDMHRADTYALFGRQLLDLSRQIHVEAILSENREWQYEYVYTEKYQRMLQHETEFRARVERAQPVEIKSEDLLDPGSVVRIARECQIDLKAMEREIKAALPPTYMKSATVA